MIAVILALLSATAYGASEFLTRAATRHATVVGAWCTSQLTATSLAVVSVAATAGPAPRLQSALWTVAGGLGGALGSLVLFRGLSRGPVSTAVPVSAVSAVGVPAAVGVALGERPSVGMAAGLALSFPALWLLTTSRDHGARSGRPTAGGTEGLLAGCGFAAMYIALGQADPGTGLWSLVLVQAPAIVLVAALLRRSDRASLRRAEAVFSSAVVGALGYLGTLLYLLAARDSLLVVVVALTSLHPAVAVGLARMFLEEQLDVARRFGLGASAGAAVLIALG